MTSNMKRAGVAVTTVVMSIVLMAGVASATPPSLPDPSDTAESFLSDNVGEAVAIILAIAGAAILIGLITFGVNRVRRVLTKNGAS